MALEWRKALYAAKYPFGKEIRKKKKERTKAPNAGPVKNNVHNGQRIPPLGPVAYDTRCLLCPLMTLTKHFSKAALRAAAKVETGFMNEGGAK